jgi:hypothetical protein
MGLVRVSIDYHEQSKRFFAKVNGKLISDNNVNGVIQAIKKGFGKQYKLTKRAQQAWESGN